MTTFMCTKIELWPVEKLIPYDQNARTHSDEQIEQIARSIQKFGFTNPILVDTGAGILAGHARLRGALRAGLPQVPVIVLDHLSYWCGDRDQGGVWSVDKPFVNELHPTMKPVELIERAIRNSSQGGELVLDPFGGSGSTLTRFRQNRAQGAAA